jgi:hypothetical protein
MKSENIYFILSSHRFILLSLLIFLLFFSTRAVVSCFFQPRRSSHGKKSSVLVFDFFSHRRIKIVRTRPELLRVFFSDLPALAPH